MSARAGAGSSGGGNFPLNITSNVSGLTNAINSIAQYEQQLVRANLATQNFATGASRIGPSISAGNTAMAQTAQSTQATTQAFANGQTTMNNFIGTAARIPQTLNQTATSEASVATNTQRMNQSFTQGQATMNNFVNTTTRIPQTLNQTAQAENTVSASTQRMNQSFGGAQTTLTGFLGTAYRVGPAINQSTAAMNANAASMGNTTRQTTMFEFANKDLVKSQDEVAEASKKTSTNVSRIGDSIGNVVGKGLGMVLSFSMLTMAMDEAQGMAEMVAASEAKLAVAHERTMQALNKYGEESKEYTRALQAEEKIESGLTFTRRNASMAAKDATFFMIMMSTSLIGLVIPALTNLKTTQESVGKAWEFMTSIIPKLRAGILAKTAVTAADTVAEGANAAATNASFGAQVRLTASTTAATIAQRASTVSTGLHTASMGSLLAVTNAVTAAMIRFMATLIGKAIGAAIAGVKALIVAMQGLGAAIMRNIAILGPIMIALVALAAVIAVIKTDFMGARTALEGFGQQLGDAVPLLSPFLHGIQGIGGALGLTGDTAEETNEHFRQMTIGFENMGILWNNTIAIMQDSNINLVRDMGFTAAAVKVELDSMTTDFTNQVDASVRTWNKFVNALMNQDYEGAVDIIAESLGSIPGIMERIGQSIAGLAEEIWRGIVAIGTDYWIEFTKVGEAIQGILQEVGARILEHLGSIGESIATWIDEQIVQPINNFVDMVFVGAQAIWDAIVGTASDIVGIVEAWVITNIVDPILGFVGQIGISPEGIWNAIIAGASAGIGILETVTKWVSDNIVAPILAIPGLITTNIISQVVSNLGFTSTTKPGEVASWLLSVALQIMSLPTKVVEKGAEIVKKLLGGDWAGEVSAWVEDVKNKITEAILGTANAVQDTVGGASNQFQQGLADAWTDTSKFFSGQPIGQQQKTETPPPPTTTTNEPTELTGWALNQDKVLNPDKYYGNTNQDSGATKTSTDFSGVSYSPSSQKVSKPDSNIPVNLAWKETMEATVGAANAASQTKPKTGYSTVSGGSSAYEQQNPDAVNKLQKQELPSQTGLEKQTANAAGASASPYEKAKTTLQGYADAAKQAAKDAQQFSKEEADLANRMAEATQIAVNRVSSEEALAMAYAGNEDNVKNYAAQIAGQQDLYDNVKQKNDELQGTLVAYGMVLNDTGQREEFVRQGRLEQDKVLSDMQVNTLKMNGTLQRYFQQVQQGGILVEAQTQGEQKLNKELLDKAVALAGVDGYQRAFNEALKAGTIQNLAYIEGQQAIVGHFQSMVESTSKTTAEYQTLAAMMDEVGNKQIVFNNGLAEGRLKGEQFLENIINQRGEFTGYRDVLLTTAVELGALGEVTNLTNSELQEFIAVMEGGPEAVNGFINSLSAFGESVISDVAKAVREGSDAVNDALDSIAEKLGDSLTGKEKLAIEIVAETDAAVAEIQDSISLAFTWAKNQKLILSSGQMDASELGSAIQERIGEAMERVEERIEQSGGVIKNSWMQVNNELKNIAADPLNTSQFIASANKIGAAMLSITGDAETAKKFMQDFGFSAEDAETALNMAASGANNLSGSLNTLNQEGNLQLEFTNQWGQAVDVFNGNVADATAKTNDWSTAQDVWRGKTQESITSATQLGQKLKDVGTNTNDAATFTNNWAQAQDVFTGKTNEAVTSATQLGQGIQGTGNAASEADPQVKQFYDTIANFGSIEAVAQVIFEQNLPAHAETGATLMAEKFQNLLPQIGVHFDAVNNIALFVFGTQIPQSAADSIPFIVAAFSLMTPNIAPYFGELEVLAITIFEINMPLHAANMVPLVIVSFANMLALATPYFLVLTQNAISAFNGIALSAQIVPQAVDQEFGKAASDGISLMNALERGSTSALNRIAERAVNAANAVGFIGQAAEFSERNVNALADAIDSLQDKTVTITIRYVTVGNPGGAGQFGLSATVNEPTWFLAGEGAGPETITISPGLMGSDYGLDPSKNNINIQSDVNTQSNVQQNGTVLQRSLNEPPVQQQYQQSIQQQQQTNGTNTAVNSSNANIIIGNDGTVTIRQGNQVISTGPAGTFIEMNNASILRTTNANPADMGNGTTNTNTNTNTNPTTSGNNINTTNNPNVQNSNIVSPGSIVGQGNNVNVQTDTNTNNNVGGNGTITQTQTNTQNPTGSSQQTQSNTGYSTVNNGQGHNTQSGSNGGQSFSQSSNVVSGSGQNIGSGHNISYQKNNSGEKLMIDGQTYSSVSGSGSGSTGQTQTNNDTGTGTGSNSATNSDKYVVINLHLERNAAFMRVVKKLIFNKSAGVYK